MDRSESYASKVRQQIEQYITESIHDLPDIFHVWSHHFIRPGMIEVFDAETINNVYFKAAEEATAGFTRPCRILSIGCGDGEVEIELAKSLRAHGVEEFRLEAVDLSPVLIERLQRSVHENGLERHLFPAIKDLNEASASDQYDMVMANHSLHHIVDLERLFEFIHTALAPDGIFATADMIGRNGHMRWPEAEVLLQAIWPLLTPKQKFHHQLLKENFEQFEDHDCSNEGFEGVRAQDILYLLLNKFNPFKFFGFGGFVDVLVDRGYGHGFNSNDEWDCEFIKALAKINDVMLDAGLLKPTMMIAYFTKDRRGEAYYRNRPARSSVRLPFENPSWTHYYESA